MKYLFFILLFITFFSSCSKVSKKEIKMAYKELLKQSPAQVIAELSEEKKNIELRLKKYKQVKNPEILKQELMELKEIEEQIAEENQRLENIKKIINLATNKQLKELKINKKELN